MDIQGNFYRCPQCSRVTQGYPIGCRTRDCPVKKDVMNDAVYGTLLTVVLFIALMGGILTVLNYSIKKDVDFRQERHYTK